MDVNNAQVGSLRQRITTPVQLELGTSHRHNDTDKTGCPANVPLPWVTYHQYGLSNLSLCHNFHTEISNRGLSQAISLQTADELSLWRGLFVARLLCRTQSCYDNSVRPSVGSVHGDKTIFFDTKWKSNASVFWCQQLLMRGVSLSLKLWPEVTTRSIRTRWLRRISTRSAPNVKS